MASIEVPATVRLVVWNCCMRLDSEKLQALAGLRPDVAVIAECGDPERIRESVDAVGGRVLRWVGRLPTKGLAVLAFGDVDGLVHESYDPGLDFLLPMSLTTPVGSLHLLAVWDMHHRSGGHEWARKGALRAGLPHYREFLSAADATCVVAGDLNDSVLWDRPGHPRSFAAVMAQLDALGLASAYHHVTAEAHGRELQPTHWWRRNEAAGYHIDFVFAPPQAVQAVTVGGPNPWLQLSDHAPLIVAIALD